MTVKLDSDGRFCYVMTPSFKIMLHDGSEPSMVLFLCFGTGNGNKVTLLKNGEYRIAGEHYKQNLNKDIAGKDAKFACLS
jgi:hypothetical protein